MGEIDCGNFFDQIDDLIKFPADAEDECGGYMDGSGSCDANPIPSVWNASFRDGGYEYDELFSATHSDDILAELPVPYEDIAQLEWLSAFVEDSFSSGGMTMGKQTICTKKVDHFQTSSPVSVLESSSSSSSSFSQKTLPPLSSNRRSPHRARSKRPRPPSFNPRSAIRLISPSSSSIESPRPLVAEMENVAESPMKKTKSPPVETASRKCLHCEISKTPQWRAGPMGPKTLCNACGVRFKSGRLFPEYRPAASPTFVPALHSNSHKKVIEMRSKGVDPTTSEEM